MSRQWHPAEVEWEADGYTGRCVDVGGAGGQPHTLEARQDLCRGGACQLTTATNFTQLLMGYDALSVMTAKAGGVLRTSTQLTLNRRPESAHSV